MNLKKKLTVTLNGDSLTALSNGEKKDLLEKIKYFMKVFFSPDIMQQVAHEMQEEHDEYLRRRTAEHEERDRQCEQGKDDCLNHA